MVEVREKPSVESIAIYGKRTLDTSIPSSQHDAAHSGVKTIEMTHKVLGKYSKWILFVSLGLAAYIYSLDSTTTLGYLNFAASEFQAQSLVSSMLVVQLALVSILKPVIAKIADVISRGTAYAGFLIFYVIGYIAIAAANSGHTVAAGIALYAVGNTGLQLLTQIIIADITTLRWRGLTSSLISLPIIINAFVSANITSSLLAGGGWRWGFGMFTILTPVTILPLIITLLWAEHKTRKLSYAQVDSVPRESFIRKSKDLASQFDLAGLLLMCSSISLIKVPLILFRTASGGWHNAFIITLIVIGCALLPTFLVYDATYARYPVMSRAFNANKSVGIAAIIAMLDNVSLTVASTYLNPFIAIVKPWSVTQISYFNQTQVVAAAVFGVAAGVAMVFLRRFKRLLTIGLAIRLLGVGLMIHSRGADGPSAEIAWAQLLQGIGLGIAAVTSLVGAQASAPHAETAIVTAFVLLLTDLGGGVGGAIVEAIWASLMPGKLAEHLPFVPEAERTVLLRSITTVLEHPRGSPIREGVIQAFGDVMKIMTIVATVIAIFPLALSFGIPNWHLTDHQNAIEQVNLKGEQSGVPVPIDPERL